MLDTDSDNDGLSDLLESRGAASDLQADGIVDNFVDNNKDGLDDMVALTPITVPDTDEDGNYNHLDLDSDNDGLTDLSEGGGMDSDQNGIVDIMQDDDGDGVPNVVDVDVTGGIDSDGDGIDDTADADFVQGPDSDADGIIDARDPDADGDGFANAYDDMFLPAINLPDTDANGIADVLEPEPELGAAESAVIPVNVLDSDGLIRTGLDGSGCSIGTDRAAFDPGLPALVLAALGFLGLRRKRKDAETGTQA